MHIAGKRIFITGGAGFIGTTLIRRLVEDNEMVVYDNFHRDAISRSGMLNHKNVVLVRGDILDFENLKKQ
ncbi:GDP-mannose 4,6-dehydratase [Candidatus Poribacteria bacterium]|nr:GDP-mannose 4,6-dehydratase [Candidatus Poribacteria bacterium]